MNAEDDWDDTEFEIDFATCCNMFCGMSYIEAHTLAVAEYNEDKAEPPQAKERK